MAKPLLPTQELDFVGLDRQMLLARLRWNASQAFSGWIDYSLACPENVILEAEALLGAMGFSLTNERTRQLTFATVTDRLMMIRKAGPHGLTLSSATAAQVSGVFSLPGGALATKVVTVTAGTRLQAGPAQYEMQATATISIGSNASGSVILENSETQSELVRSDGSADQVVGLSSYPVIDSSVVIAAANGTYRTTRPDNGMAYRSFLEMSGATLGAVVRVDNEGRGYVFFGNGLNGVIPQGNVQITYKTGGGSSGRVVSGASWTFLDAVYDESGSQTTVLFANPAASTGGLDQMSVEEARVRLPMQIRVRERTVNEDDAETTAETTGGIVRATLMTSNHSKSIPEDTGRLYLVALGAQYADTGYYPPAAPTTAQIAAVTAKIARGGEAPVIMGARVTVHAFIARTVNVAVRVHKASGISATAAKAAVTSALQTHFAVANSSGTPLYTVGFGHEMLSSSGVADYELPWSDLFGAIRSTPEIRKIPSDPLNLLLNGAQASVFLKPEEFPVLGALTVYDMDTGGTVI